MFLLRNEIKPDMLSSWGISCLIYYLKTFIGDGAGPGAPITCVAVVVGAF